MARLLQGTLAPDFTAQTFDGKRVNLSAYRGKKVWLCFYRYSKCPLCNDHLHQVFEKYKGLKRNHVEVIAIYESSPDKFRKNLSASEFPLVSDPNKELYKLYGLEKSLLAVFKPKVLWAWLRANSHGFLQTRVDGDMGQIPAHFLIREDGLIHTAYYGKDISDQIPWWIVERFANEESVAEWKKRMQAAGLVSSAKST